MKSIDNILSFISVIVLLTCCSSSDKGTDELVQTEKVTLSIVDKSATMQTKALLSHLWTIQDKGFMFGHHDDLFYGRKWYNESGRSDTKEVCGDYPAVFGVDFAPIMDDRYQSNAEENAIRKRCCEEAYRRGMVILACAHLDNPLTNKDSWDNSNNQVVAEILKEGSATNKVFKTWLDRLADFVNNLKGDKGELIPVIFRMFHEHTQTWSWWGSSCTTETEFINLWRYVVTYLRDTKGVHNLLYAVSPQMDSAKTPSDFLFRWPGDDYVDFIGMDSYQGINNSVFVTNLKALVVTSRNKMKPCGVTETGVEGFDKTDYWTTNILAPMTGRKVSMLVTWRNKFDPTEAGTHYFSVFPEHPSVPDFIKMYKSDISLFCNDLPEMYVQDANVNIK